MKLNLLLHITDPKLRKQYDSHRRKQIILLCGLLLIFRLITFVYRCLFYMDFKACILKYYFILSGIGVHIFALLISIKWEWPAKLCSVIVSLSYLNIAFCTSENLTQGNDVAALLDIFSFDYVTSLFLNKVWILTCSANLTLRLLLFKFYVSVINPYYDELIYPLVLGWIVQTILVYFSERILKELYLATHRIEISSSHLDQLFSFMHGGLLVLEK